MTENPVDAMTAEETATLAAMRSEPVPADEPEAVVEHVADNTPEPEAKPEAPAPKPHIKLKADTAVVEPEAAAEPPAKPPAGFVPHGAFHEEREGRKAAEAKIAALEARFAEIEARVPKPEEAKAERPKMPDPVTHPEEFEVWLEERNKAPVERVQQIEEGQRQAAMERQRLETASTLEQQFAATTPDYGPAVAHLQQQRVAELKAIGYGDQPVRLVDGREIPSIAQVIRQEANTIFDNATRTGQNPAEMLYGLAKARGWSAPEAATDPTPAPTVSEAARVMALARAQKETATLSTSPGEAASTAPTAAQLARMSEEDLAKVDKAVLRKAFGG